MIWEIYFGDAEFARIYNDPCLGTVEAKNKREAERLADEGKFIDRTKVAMVPGVGVWAIPAENKVQNYAPSK